MNKQELIALIKQKREYREIDDSFVERILDDVLKGREVESLKKKSIEDIIKQTRAKLREVYGAFLSPKYSQKEKFLNAIKNLNDFEGHKKVLSLHLSTRERLPFYEEIYSKIFEITGKPSSILDLGCGLNPFSLPFMHLTNLIYYAAELVKTDAEFLQKYFNKFNIKGKAFQMDLTRAENLPSADVCFMFKVIDTLEAIEWDTTAELLAKVKAKWIIASFAKKSLGGKKKIKMEKRAWFEKLIAKREHKVFGVENEMFYVIKK